MNKIWTLSVAAGAVMLFSAITPAVQAGATPRNMIYNSNMYSSGVNDEFPDGWSAVYHLNMPIWKKSADGKSRTVLFRNDGARGANSDIRAFSSLYIEPGEKYRFRLKVRTRNCTAGKLGFVAFGPGWNGSFGINYKLPENSDWTTIDEVHTASTGRGNIYSFAIHLAGFKGEVEVASPEILPESEKAIAAVRYVDAQFPVQPCKPILNNVPASDDVTLTFRDYGNKDGWVTYSCNGGAEQKAVVDKNKLYTLKLGKLTVGKHALTVKNSTGSENFDLTVTAPLPADTMGKYINNFHRIAGSWQMQENSAQKLVLPRSGMIRFAMPEGCTVKISGKTVSCSNGEAVYLPAGVHEITMSGKASAQVTAAWMVETLLYPLANGPLNFRSLQPLDYEHVQKHLFPAYSTFVAYGDHITRQQVKAMLDEGHHRMYASASMAAVSKLSPDDGRATADYFNERNKSELASRATIIDEIENNIPLQTQFFGNLFKNMNDLPDDQIVHIWLCGGVVYSDAFTAAFLHNSAAATRNMIHHYEIYLAPERSEEASYKYIQKKFSDLKELMKMSPETIGVTLSHCNLPFVYQAAIYPHVNYKYFLDMQLNVLANDPAFRGLNAVGFWADHYTDKEHSRFAADLLKHYVLDGKKEMFTKQFGYNFAPGFVKNPDFENGMQHWQVQGSVKSVTADLFGRNWQRRTTNGTVGDTFAQFTRGKTANSISQQVTGLTPGRIYSLSFISGDAVRLRQTDHRKGEITCKIDGVKILPEYSERSNREAKDRGNYDKIVFEALSGDAQITFSDEKSPEGLRSYLNYVCLMPFYTGSDADKK